MATTDISIKNIDILALSKQRETLIEISELKNNDIIKEDNISEDVPDDEMHKSLNGLLATCNQMITVADSLKFISDHISIVNIDADNP